MLEIHGPPPGAKDDLTTTRSYTAIVPDLLHVFTRLLGKLCTKQLPMYDGL